MAEPEQYVLPIVGRDLMSVTQAAAFLERSADRVRQYADSGALKHMRFGPKRERYFAPIDVANFKRLMEANQLLRMGSTWRVPVAARRS